MTWKKGVRFVFTRPGPTPRPDGGGALGQCFDLSLESFTSPWLLLSRVQSHGVQFIGKNGVRFTYPVAANKGDGGN
jgi:hypothetical protein